MLLAIIAGASQRIAAATPEADFAARCAASGVLVCEGFDSASTFVYSQSQSQGLYPISGTQTIRGFQDSAIKASGTSSLRFDILTNTQDDNSGAFTKNFGQTFSQNSTFYVQFRQRFDSNMLSIDWSGLMGTAYKQAIMYDKDGFTCANIELTTVVNDLNGNTKNQPIMYSECGSGHAWGTVTDPSLYRASTPLLIQQGTDLTRGYNCQYGSENVIGTGNGVGCFNHIADKWITFYYKIRVGTWNSANSSIEAWVSFDGGPYLQWTNIRNYTLRNDGNSAGGWSKIMLTSYMTNKNSSVAHATAKTWYDELIISTQPIVAPGRAYPAPMNLRVQ